MACACKDKEALTPDSRALARSYPNTNDYDIVTLQAEPECVQPYDGPFRQATVFIVGYTTDAETMYRRGDRKKALAHARKDKLTFDQVPARAICHDLAVELLGS